MTTAKRKPISLDPAAFADAAIPQPDPVHVATEPRRFPAVDGSSRPTKGSKQGSRVGKVQVQCWVTEDTRRRLKVLAANTGRTVELLLTGAIDDLLARHHVR
ncbi:MAG: hypothetical protein EPN22_17590 [Nitrospirae bacterium]|nr:MAG: hypothetical protein EPN22_17590 [Nitrospirota bacterium]